VTSGGLYGTVVGVTDATVQLRIADQVKVEVARHAIAELRQE
jgi:preprotein translocase YajC subunit